jgi:hypothetical protein
MWIISVVCMSLVCQPIPYDTRTFGTYAQCVTALRVVASRWQPTIGAYTFNCRKTTDRLLPPGDPSNSGRGR